MELKDYITQAEQEYPNGYADYIKKYPNDTPEIWQAILEATPEKVIKYNDNLNINSFLDMAEWDNNKLWTVLGTVEYNYKTNK